MATSVFNLIWYHPRFKTRVASPRDNQLARHKSRVRIATRWPCTKGFILFPSLLTPMVHVKKSGGRVQPTLDILVATKDMLTREWSTTN